MSLMWLVFPFLGFLPPLSCLFLFFIKLRQNRIPITITFLSLLCQFILKSISSLQAWKFQRGWRRKIQTIFIWIVLCKFDRNFLFSRYHVAEMNFVFKRTVNEYRSENKLQRIDKKSNNCIQQQKQSGEITNAGGWIYFLEFFIISPLNDDLFLFIWILCRLLFILRLFCHIIAITKRDGDFFYYVFFPLLFQCLAVSQLIFIFSKMNWAKKWKKKLAFKI